mmetsp:Transcript_105961/g.298557  ORF Transcript_105961/g.298557 Transcript_105961/m.298557 type:complete len:209 (+) Transcript_105961:174-800(+)
MPPSSPYLCCGRCRGRPCERSCWMPRASSTPFGGRHLGRCCEACGRSSAAGGPYPNACSRCGESGRPSSAVGSSRACCKPRAQAEPLHSSPPTFAVDGPFGPLAGGFEDDPITYVPVGWGGGPMLPELSAEMSRQLVGLVDELRWERASYDEDARQNAEWAAHEERERRLRGQRPSAHPRPRSAGRVVAWSSAPPSEWEPQGLGAGWS